MSLSRFWPMRLFTFAQFGQKIFFKVEHLTIGQVRLS